MMRLMAACRRQAAPALTQGAAVDDDNRSSLT